MANIFWKYSAWFGGLGLKSRPFSVYQPDAINEKPVVMSLWLSFLKVCTETLKNSKYCVLRLIWKWNEHHISVVSK